MHGGGHIDNVGTLDPTTVSLEYFKEIHWGNMGVEGVWVSETPDPSISDDLEDEGSAYHLAGSDERMGENPGGPFTLHFFTKSVGGIVFDAGSYDF